MAGLAEELPHQDPREVAGNIDEFLEGKSGLPINTVRLAGKPGEEIAACEAAVALHSTGGLPSELTIQVVTSSKPDWRKLYRLVKRLNIPEGAFIFTDTNQGPEQVQACRDQGWPVAVVTLGLGKESGQLVADMVVISSLSPAETLAALKNKIDQRFLQKAGEEGSS